MWNTPEPRAFYVVTNKPKPKKAPGKDGIPNDVSNTLGIITRQNLLLNINNSWNIGKLSDWWREAVIISIKRETERQTQEIHLPTDQPSHLSEQFDGKNGQHKDAQTSRRKPYAQKHSQITWETASQTISWCTVPHNVFHEKKVIAAFVDLIKAFENISKEWFLLKLFNKKV